ncbi:MAG: TIM barrel protein [Lewinellaceae bacterium]|nr:TIM barrel protein [Saprospiraceae bacterium]MCB9316994.1 TIM barrel protein [Lewinellaceae bacterium]MCB9330190.1 TIM barrel protein [Lewinellaceae bacterium]
MNMKTTRRNALKTLALGAAALATDGPALLAKQPESKPSQRWKGRVNHSVCRWCFKDIPLEEFCQAVAAMGMPAIDLVGPDEWPVLKKYGLYSSMCNGAELGLTQGWNDPQYHEQLLKNYSEMIPKVAEAGYRNLICFSGNRNGMDDAVGMENCVSGLEKLLPLAEKNGVLLCMELLNSKINHPDYMCDKSPWGVELCKRLGSENFKLLYDIYHMQVNEGDVIHTIQEFHPYFAHYHTAGVPGRHEIDDSQELYYPAIMRAIVETGFTGYVAQEFVPKSPDKLAALAAAMKICDV